MEYNKLDLNLKCSSPEHLEQHKDKCKRLILEANKAFTTADHLMYVTYPLLKDIKLLFAVTQNLYIAGIRAIDALLQYERFYKKIDAIPLDFDSKFHVFQTKTAPRHNIDRETIKTVAELREIMKRHKESPMVFTRKDKYVICSNAYSSMLTIDIQKLKNYHTQIKQFVKKAMVTAQQYDSTIKK